MDIKKILAALDAKKERLSRHRPLTQGELDRLGEEFTIGFTYNSNAIEGNTLTLDETALVLREGITIGGKTLKEHMEVIGHRDAWLYAQELVKEGHPLSERDILQLHSLVLHFQKEDAGVYRRLPVRIMGAAVELPQPWEVPVQMEQLLADYHGAMGSLHPVQQAAQFHLRFESIHPFIDGNGRTGRLLLNLELMKDGYLPIDIKHRDRQRYMECFRAWQQGEADPGPMVDLVAQYVDARLEEYLRMLEIANGRGRPGPGVER